MLRLRVSHETVYRYREPVHFGEHVLMLRPRDSHDLRLLWSTLDVAPEASLRWHHDVFGNSVATAQFWEPGEALRIASTLVLEHYDAPAVEGIVEGVGNAGVGHYDASHVKDLAPAMEPHHADPDGLVEDWARAFVPDGTAATGQFRTLVAMTQAIRGTLTWEERHEPGVQEPVETLTRGRGSCRDFALLMMEGARRLGFAARFVSGYLYNRGLAGDGGELVGGGATHAWLEVYLMGAGWVDFDPTNGSVGNGNLVRVAVAREPGQAVPVRGVYYGAAGAALAMDVSVHVVAEAPPA